MDDVKHINLDLNTHRTNQMLTNTVDQATESSHHLPVSILSCIAWVIYWEGCPRHWCKRRKLCLIYRDVDQQPPRCTSFSTALGLTSVKQVKRERHVSSKVASTKSSFLLSSSCCEKTNIYLLWHDDEIVLITQSSQMYWFTKANPREGGRW